MNANTSPEENGNGTKVLAMAFLGLGSFLTGLLPAVVSNINLRRFPLTTSLMLCFGAGILLATSLVHMLPDVRKFMPSNAEIVFCGGFFIVYFIDEFIHYFFGEAIQHLHNVPGNASTTRHHHQNNHSHHHEVQRLNYGSTSETESLLQHNSSHVEINCNSRGLRGLNRETHCDDVMIADANARICHSSHAEPCAQSRTGTIGLFVALSLHSIIEGLAIGVQDSSTKVLFLFGAVACHKFVMAFCLGLEFRLNPSSTVRSQVIAILIFSMGSVIGIIIGMFIIDIPLSWQSTTFPIIQGLAGGTLFYVTVCEVIPREKAQWHQNQERKIAGFLQFIAVAIGFFVMTLVDFYVDD